MSRLTRPAAGALCLAAAAILVAGCSSGQPPASTPSATPLSTPLSTPAGTSASPTPASPSTPPSPTTATPSAVTPTASISGTGGRHVMSVGDASNGKTITLSRGDRLTVTLMSTYWQFAPVAGGVLTASGQQTTPSRTQAGTTCVPGQGCGTAVETFTARQSGRTRITASRTSCGEAMACVGSAGSYVVTVVVR